VIVRLFLSCVILDPMRAHLSIDHVPRPCTGCVCFLLPFSLFFAFCCLVLGLSTVFAPASPSLVLAEAAAATFFALALPSLVLAHAAAATFFTLGLPSIVLADAAAATVLALVPHSLVLADAAAATVLALAPHSLVLADAAAATVFTLSLHPLVLTDAAAATEFTLAPQSIVLADVAADTVLARAPHSLVLAEAAAATVLTHAPHTLVLADAAAATFFTRALPSPMLTVVFVRAAISAFGESPVCAFNALTDWECFQLCFSPYSAVVDWLYQYPAVPVIGRSLADTTASPAVTSAITGPRSLDGSWIAFRHGCHALAIV